ncbi:MAG: VTT domain-containing protein [Candidatus Hodarchaeota archaeon]
MVNLANGKIRDGEIMFIIATVVCFVMAIILQMELLPQLNIWINNFSDSMVAFGTSGNVLWAAFLMSMFGNTSVFLVFPYALIILQISALNTDLGVTFPLVIGVLSGLGAGVGEVTSYIIGRLFTKSDKLVSSELGQKFERMRKTFEEHPKSIPFIIYIFALTPLPDDAILVPFGVMKYSYWKTIIPCMLGKMTLCIFLAYLGFFVDTIPALEPIANLFRSEGDASQDMIFLWIMFLVIYLMLRLDFEKIVKKKEKSEVQKKLEAGEEVHLDKDGNVIKS